MGRRSAGSSGSANIHCGQCPFVTTTSAGLRLHELSAHEDIDEVVVDRLVAGEYCEASQSEKRAAGIRLFERGFSIREAAVMLRVSTRTSCRWRKAVDLPALSQASGRPSDSPSDEWSDWRLGQ